MRPRKRPVRVEPEPLAPSTKGTTLNLRKVPIAVVARAQASASARQMTLPQYFAALLQLHETMRARADAGDVKLQAELIALGLQTVRA